MDVRLLPICSLLVALALVLSPGTGASAATGTVPARDAPYGAIDLTVRDQAGKPLPNEEIGIVRDGITGRVRVGSDGRGHFSYPSNILIDICGGYEFVSPAHPLSCVRSVAVAPSQTTTVELVVDVLPFNTWVSAFASADWLVGFTPFWVQSFQPHVILWSGPDEHALAFGTRQLWSYFLVAGPQVGSRLYVFDNSFKDYAWLDAAVVGPSGAPPQIIACPAVVQADTVTPPTSSGAGCPQI